MVFPLSFIYLFFYAVKKITTDKHKHWVSKTVLRKASSQPKLQSFWSQPLKLLSHQCCTFQWRFWNCAMSYYHLSVPSSSQAPVFEHLVHGWRCFKWDPRAFRAVAWLDELVTGEGRALKLSLSPGSGLALSLSSQIPDSNEAINSFPLSCLSQIFYLSDKKRD